MNEWITKQMNEWTNDHTIIVLIADRIIYDIYNTLHSKHTIKCISKEIMNLGSFSLNSNINVT